jgi:hypothetical protein
VVKPVLQALLVADQVYEDKRTGKKIIAGVFHNLWFKRQEDVAAELKKQGLDGTMPGGMLAGSPTAYACLTEIRGKQPFVLRYVDLQEDTPLFQAEFNVSCADPLKVVELVLPLPPLPATKAGTFALELLWKDEPLGSFRVTVAELQTEGPKDDNDAN